MREAVLKLTMDYKMTKHMLNNGTLNGSRTWLLVRTWHCYFISFDSEHPVTKQCPLFNAQLTDNPAAVYESVTDKSHEVNTT